MVTSRRYLPQLQMMSKADPFFDHIAGDGIVGLDIDAAFRVIVRRGADRALRLQVAESRPGRRRGVRHAAPGQCLTSLNTTIVPVDCGSCGVKLVSVESLQSARL